MGSTWPKLLLLHSVQLVRQWDYGLPQDLERDTKHLPRFR